MELRDYQKESIDEILKHFKNGEREVVLSLCPSGGKTFTAIELIRKMGLKTLILSHGTSVLRTQWADELKKHKVPFSDEFGRKITVNLPHSLYKKDLPQVDLLVVDEAHEFYLAKKKVGKKITTSGMVAEIVKKCNPKYILLLTGTPSKFILSKTPCVIVSADRLLEQGFISDLYFGVASTNQKFKDSDHNAEGDLKGTTKIKDTKATLDNLLEAMRSRLHSTGAIKVKPNIQLTVGKIFHKLDKTMIACANIKQADEVYNYFKKAGVNVLSSHEKSDRTSENMQRFMDEPDVKVLVVVNRGVLGFNYPELVNVVDMTLSRNIDRIYQLYARVMRQHKNNRKYFFKVVPEDQSDLYKFYMSAALALTNKDIISKFNGKNLQTIEIAHRVRGPRKKKVKGKKGIKVNPFVPVDAIFYEDVMAMGLLIDLKNKKGRAWNEYAFTTFGKMREVNYGISRKIVKVTREDLIQIRDTGIVLESIYG